MGLSRENKIKVRIAIPSVMIAIGLLSAMSAAITRQDYASCIWAIYAVHPLFFMIALHVLGLKKKWAIIIKFVPISIGISLFNMILSISMISVYVTIGIVTQADFEIGSPFFTCITGVLLLFKSSLLLTFCFLYTRERRRTKDSSYKPSSDLKKNDNYNSTAPNERLDITMM